MNWANRVTLSRLVLTVLFVLTLNSSWQYARTSALVIFLAAGLTDFIDGEIEEGRKHRAIAARSNGAAFVVAETQVRAKSQDDVYALTPARCRKVTGKG